MTKDRRWLIIGTFVLLVAFAYVGRERVREAGGKSMAAAVSGYAEAVPLCRERVIAIRQDQWDRMPKENRVQAAKALVNLCESFWPWNEYSVVDTASRKTLATASRFGGVEIRAQ